MALKAILDSLDDVPEEQHGLYTETDGKFILDLDGLEDHPEAAALKSALERAIGRDKESKKKVKELEGEFEKYKDIDPEKAREALEQLQAMGDKKLIEEGKLDELVEQKVERMRAEFATQLEAKDKALGESTDSLEARDTELADIKIFGVLKDAALNKGLKKSALPDIVSRARAGDIKWELREGVPTPVKENEIVFGKSGDVMTPDEWVETQIVEAEHLFEPNRGGGADGGDGKSGKDGMKIVDLSQDNAIGQNLEAFAEGKARPAA